MNKMIGTFFLVFATLCFSNAETGELIIDAIKNGDISKLRLATFDSGNINSFDSAGMGYIHYAAMYGGQRELDLLLKKGANINLQSRTKKRTPLQMALINGNMESAKYLINKGCDVNAKSNDGATAVLIAAQNNQIDVMKWLIDK